MLHIFDLDHTLLRRNCSCQFGKYLYQKRLISPLSAFHSALAYFFCRHLHLVSSQRAHQFISRRCFSPFSFSFLQQNADAFLQQQIDSSLFFSPLVKKLKAIQDQPQATILLLSNSPMFLVEPIAAYLHISHWHATEYRVKNDRLSDLVAVCEGKKKAEIALQFAQKHQLDLRDATAYTDSHVDLPLLECVGFPVAVNPSRRLLSLCKKKSWPFLSFNESFEKQKGNARTCIKRK